jgi:hypothetical protein
MKHILSYLSSIRRSIGLQFVYCMAIIPPRDRWWSFRWVVKVGVSDTPRQRCREVEAGVRNHTGQQLNVYVLPLPVFAPRPCEAALHRVLRPLASNPFPGTSGHTEWFRSLNLLTGFAVFLCAYADGLPLTAAIGWWALVALLPVPFDAALLVLLVASLHWGVFIAALWGAVKIIALCGLSG